MQKRIGLEGAIPRRVLLALSLTFGVGASADAKWIPVDVAGSFQTTPVAISDSEAVTGTWIDNSGIIHGFVRARDGAITSFDAGQNTIVLAINRRGSIAGYYDDFNGDESGFVRAPDGTITAFTVPGTINTVPSGINAKGGIGGYAYSIEAERYIGFLRSPGGGIKTFQIPNTSQTYGYTIDDLGDIAGAYVDGNGYFHGFLRNPDGKIAKYSIPDVDAIGLVPAGIDSSGEVAGTFAGGDYVSHCFLRKADGTVVTLDLSGWSFCQIGSGENGGGINAGGVMAGSFTDSSGDHGFLMQPDGSVRKLDYPGGDYETTPVSIGDKGEVTGFYLGSTFEGFVWKRP